MPIPTRRPTETKKKFFARCMADDKMLQEYPDQQQRYQVCKKQSDKPLAAVAATYPAYNQWLIKK